ncbi:MAG: glycine cleavage system aminomethyltransferase GcvT [Bacteroidetes bacterium]|nr:glycine cleavage system aminomethyltransferase GcvT [Rhodothermia bacterium]MCX7905939.1 glycine cleavage system aminomethyltransferase GcvT [Bacteroidota bacterium]MDW8138094.1 glycine cleavage system aminomethyltransferase GcvT [Bacteroidota bacterium]MDW8285778.1 glycine cleavage system aminomethyltransferase GcvT [Bacteroidota bacterium]
MSALKRTPLHAHHLRAGAKMVPFGGFEMPLQYTSIVEEHRAVRERAGLFDVSHMGEILVRGPRASAFLQELTTNDVSRLADGKAQYSLLCREDGGIVDDLLVFRISESEYLLVVNAANTTKDWAHLAAHNRVGAELVDVSEETALLALQGPLSEAILSRLLPDLDVSAIPHYRFRVLEDGRFLGCRRALLSATGYTGERGFELFVESDRAPAVWEALWEVGSELGLALCGLGARDTLRLEMGYCLYGNDITEQTHPYEAGLGWIVKLEKGPFVGREALARIRTEGVRRRLVGFRLEKPNVPRREYAIVDPEDGRNIGTVTSGTYSPSLDQGIGMGYVPVEYSQSGSRIGIAIRGRIASAEVVTPPFVPRKPL